MDQNQHYPQTPPPGYQQQYAAPGYPPMQQDLPNATGVMVLGILSIVFAGGIGLILAIIALVMASGAMRHYNANPGIYTQKSFSRVKTGRICAIIALCLIGLILLIIAVVIGVSL
jgi:hypothetical protein